MAPEPAPDRKPTGKPRRKQAYAEALVMQRGLFKATCDESIPAAVRAQCARAWDVLEERKRILRNKPLPGILRPDLVIERAEAARRKGKGLFTPALLDQAAPLPAKDAL